MKYKSRFYFISITLILIIVVICCLLLFYNTKIVETKQLVVKYEIGERAGFNVESETVNFGRLIPGNTGTRKISIHNEYSFPVAAKIVPSTNLNGLLLCNCSMQLLLPNQTIEMPLTLRAPKDAIVGNYTGFIKVKIFSS